MSDRFWTNLDKLIATSEIVIDRPKGSAHPRYPQMIYPLDYGYLKGTCSCDGNEIDVWKGSLPDAALNAVVMSVDLMKNDSEVKVLLGCTDDEIQTILDFYNQNPSMSAMVVKAIRRDQSNQ